MWVFATTLALAAESVVDSPERPVDVDLNMEMSIAVLSAAFGTKGWARQELSPAAERSAARQRAWNEALADRIAARIKSAESVQQGSSTLAESDKVPRRRGRPSGNTETASRLVDSAVKLLEDGIPMPSLTVTLVAQRADHGASAVYNHYGNADELLLAARRAWTKRLDEFEPTFDLIEHPLLRLVHRAFLLAEDAHHLPEFYREMFFRQPGPPPWPFSLHTLAEFGIVFGGLLDLHALIVAGDVQPGIPAESLLSAISIFLRPLTFLIVYRPDNMARMAETLAPIVRTALEHVLFSEAEVPRHCVPAMDSVEVLFGRLAAEVGT
jgi:AcrR family transcriptional regulator